jgi:hypothetical protein
MNLGLGGHILLYRNAEPAFTVEADVGYGMLLYPHGGQQSYPQDVTVSLRGLIGEPGLTIAEGASEGMVEEQQVYINDEAYVAHLELVGLNRRPLLGFHNPSSSQRSRRKPTSRKRTSTRRSSTWC